MFYSLEGLRGVAALIVALFHTWESTATSLPLVQHGWLFVDLFFVISGFVMSHVYRDAQSSKSVILSFLIKRFGRLYPLHFITLLVFILAEHALQYAKHAAAQLGHAIGSNPVNFSLIDLPSIFYHALLLHGIGLKGTHAYNGPSWSISTEFWTYLVFGLSLWLFAKNRRSQQMGTWGLLCIGGLAACLLAGKNSLVILDGFAWCRCIYSYFLGAMLPGWRDMMSPRKTTVAWMQVATLLISVVMVSIANESSRLTFLAPLGFAALVLSLSFDAGPVHALPPSPPAKFLGKISYSMYMTHSTLLGFFNPIGGMLHEPYKSLLTAIYVVTLIYISSQTYRLIEAPWRYRFRKWADAMSSKPQDSAVANDFEPPHEKLVVANRSGDGG
jgi:peptidoglycan/LPS O-acetylase OafA/YrhL